MFNATPAGFQSTTHWIVTVDGKPTDIRGTSELATRQGKVRKGQQPDARVELHYGEATVAYRYDERGRLVIDVIAETGPSTHLATFLP